jgi:ABC-type ATPase involved in cell division
VTQPTARALVDQPVVVLADELTGNLDSAATTDVLRVRRKLMWEFDERLGVSGAAGSPDNTGSI